MATFDVAPLVEPPPAPSEETSDNGIRLVAKLAVKRTGLPLDRFSRLVSPSEAATLLSPPVTPAVAVDNVEGKAEEEDEVHTYAEYFHGDQATKFYFDTERYYDEEPSAAVHDGYLEEVHRAALRLEG